VAQKRPDEAAEIQRRFDEGVIARTPVNLSIGGRDKGVNPLRY
jgi:hypothetical protein